MKKTLAVVLALAMVLCMIPAAFAATTKSISDKSYDLTVYSYSSANANISQLATEKAANSITAKYNYENEDEDVTGKFTEDKKMAIVKVAGFDADLPSDVDVTIDGKDLEVNDLAAYAGKFVGFDPTEKAVYFPVELTKAGYSDTYVIRVTGTTSGDVEITETAKVTVKLVNTAEYKNSKTATISSIESKSDELDAYIVGSKIYLDFTSTAKNISEAIKITFKDENGSAFKVVTWAEQTETKGGAGGVINLAKEAKLDDSAIKYNVNAADHNGNDYCKELSFKLETSSAIYETKEYDVIIRENISEADPKGIYFAESTKTIKIGESYTPVVMGVATGKKVSATILPGEGTEKQVIDIEDDDTVIGTKEGVAYITATYTAKGTTNTYRASSMKIVVTASTVEESTTTGNTYKVTASTLNVRKGPGTSYAKAYQLKYGATVTVESITNGWAKLSDGNYASAQYLVKTSTTTSSSATTMYVTCRTLNVRSGAGTSYSKVGTLSRNTAVEVVSVSNGWAKLSNGNYVAYKYLSL